MKNKLMDKKKVLYAVDVENLWSISVELHTQLRMKAIEMGKNRGH